MFGSLLLGIAKAVFSKALLMKAAVDAFSLYGVASLVLDISDLDGSWVDVGTSNSCAALGVVAEPFSERLTEEVLGRLSKGTTIGLQIGKAESGLYIASTLADPLVTRDPELLRAEPTRMLRSHPLRELRVMSQRELTSSTPRSLRPFD